MKKLELSKLNKKILKVDILFNLAGKTHELPVYNNDIELCLIYGKCRIKLKNKEYEKEIILKHNKKINIEANLKIYLYDYTIDSKIVLIYYC